MKDHRWLLLALILVLVLPVSPIQAQVPPQIERPAASLTIAEGNWYLVEFEAPPLAVHARSEGVAARAMFTGDKLNVESAASQAYVNRLVEQQSQFRASLTRAIPGATVQRGYQVAPGC